MSSTLIGEHRRPGRTRRALGAPQAAGVAGILCALLLIAAITTIRSSLDGPPTLGLLTHGSAAIDDGRVEFGLSLVPDVAITFIWFMAVVRSQFASPTNDMFGTVFLATGVLFLGSLLVASAIGLSVMDLRSAAPAGSGGALWLGGGAVYDLLFLIAPRMAGAFVLISANLLHRVNLMPRWLTVATMPVGVFLLFIIRRIDWIVFVLPVWMIAVSVLILLRLGRVTED